MKRVRPSTVVVLLLVAAPAYLTFEFHAGGLPDEGLRFWVIAGLTFAPGVLLGATALWVTAGG